MATLIAVGLVVLFGALFAAMAVTPLAMEELNARQLESKKVATPVTFERQMPHLAPAHEVQAA